ncbi:MAG: PadR family transcriptional regulator [Terriglobales bacterium]
METEKLELLRGTLDLLILKTLRWGPTHGHGIAQAIGRQSEGAFHIEHGSLYPALQRLLQQGWVRAEWSESANKRRARYYRLTAAGRRHLVREESRWERFTRAVGRILGAETPA